MVICLGMLYFVLCEDIKLHIIFADNFWHAWYAVWSNFIEHFLWKLFWFIWNAIVFGKHAEKEILKLIETWKFLTYFHKMEGQSSQRHGKIAQNGEVLIKWVRIVNFCQSSSIWQLYLKWSKYFNKTLPLTLEWDEKY